MKKLFRNLISQASLEKLVTYAWAFLIILIIVGILYYFGVWDLPSPKKCILAAGLACSDLTVKSDEVQINIFHNLGRAITINTIEVDDCPMITPDQTLEKYEKFTFIIGPCTITEKKYSSDLTITYTNTETGLPHTIKGEIRSPVNA